MKRLAICSRTSWGRHPSTCASHFRPHTTRVVGDTARAVCTALLPVSNLRFTSNIGGFRPRAGPCLNALAYGTDTRSSRVRPRAVGTQASLQERCGCRQGTMWTCRTSRRATCCSICRGAWTSSGGTWRRGGRCWCTAPPGSPAPPRCQPPLSSPLATRRLSKDACVCGHPLGLCIRVLARPAAGLQRCITALRHPAARLNLRCNG